MIAKEILEACGAQIRVFKKGEIIFKKGSRPIYYYQILTGKVKMTNYNDVGKEFVQGFFKKDMSFGEPPLILDEPYPANAEAQTEVKLLALPKDVFLELLCSDEEVNFNFIKDLAFRIYFKAIMAPELASESPEHRLLSIIDYYKKDAGITEKFGFRVNHTRQELANITGLRVETVIRAIKQLEKQGKVKLLKSKILR